MNSQKLPGKLTATEVITALGLTPHREGGHYRRTFCDPKQHNGRAVSTAIYYLLAKGELSHWHRIDVAEVWHWYAGAPLILRVAECNEVITHRLGTDFLEGERPQAVVPAHAWQAAESLGSWTLSGCTVAPGFVSEELAPEGWQPGT